MPQFEVFKKRMVPLIKTPYVTIQKRGTMGFNAAAHAALGSPQAIELLFDPHDRIMGVRAVDPHAQHAYPIRPNSGDQHARTFLVSGTAFVRYYGIDTTVSRRWPATMQDGILCVDLKEPGTEVTGNRSRPKDNDPLGRPLHGDLGKVSRFDPV